MKTRTNIILFIVTLTFISCSGKNENSPSEKKEKAAMEKNKDKQEEEKLYSDLTCPFCGFTENILMPTESCLIKHTCSNCKKEIFPKEGDCCVFCTYGTVKCPSMQ